MARSLFDTGIFSVIASSGGLGIGYQLGFYTAGTTSKITTWNAATSGSANANPVVTDANARFPQIWVDQSQTIKWVLMDSDGAVLDTADNVPVNAVPSAPDASLTNFLAATAPLSIANGGTNATSAANALVQLGALPAAGGTLTGEVTRFGKGNVPYFHDAAMAKPEIFVSATGGADPRGGLPGQIWLRY